MKINVWFAFSMILYFLGFVFFCVHETLEGLSTKVTVSVRSLQHVQNLSVPFQIYY